MTTKNWLILCGVAALWVVNLLCFTNFALHTTLEGQLLQTILFFWFLLIGMHAVLVLACAAKE